MQVSGTRRDVFVKGNSHSLLKYQCKEKQQNMGVRMKKIIMSSSLVLVFLITGCQSNNIEEVVNIHGDIQNLEGLNEFIENVNNQNEAEINYVQYGTEGQRGVKILTFDGEQINVSFSTDGDFVEKYNCQKVKVETKEEINKYILSECTGNFNGDSELLSVPNKNI